MPERSPQSLWETALGRLELEVTRPNFDTWLRQTVGLRQENGTFIIGVQSDFALEWLRSRMGGPISRVVSQLLGTPTTASFEVLGIHGAESALDRNGSRATEPVSTPQSCLDPRLTFDSFTVVDCNRFAFRAARKVASTGAAYNPLVLCAPPGHGKTHLLHAIAHHASHADRRVLLLSGEQFVDAYARAVRAGQPHTFRTAFDSATLLLVDDLQFLASRAGSQEQFFHIFNTLRSQQRLVVVSIDQPLGAIAGFTDHLRSQLDAGLTVDLSAPCREEQLAILRAKAAQISPPIPEPVIQLILRQPLPNISALEGSLNRAAAFLQLSDSPPSLDRIEQALRPFGPPSSPPDAYSVLDAVCSRFGLSRDAISGKSRARDIAYARHVAMYLMRKLSQRPLAEIGKLLGGRDHTTVLSGFRRISRELNALESTQADIRQLEASLRCEPSA